MLRAQLSSVLCSLSCAVVFAFTGAAHAATQAPTPSDRAPTALHLLDYMAVDYAGAVEKGRIKSADEYAEMQEFAAEVVRIVTALPAHPQQKQLTQQAQALQQSVARKAEATAINEQSRTLRMALVQAYDVRITPRGTPDLSRAATLYAQQCASCHGAQGQGDGPAGRTLDPAPANFHDAERMAQRSVYSLYNTVSLGVNGTGMGAYSQLSDDDRWSLALFVANFTADEGTRSQGRQLWNTQKRPTPQNSMALAYTLSAQEAQQQNADAVSLQQYLRSSPQLLNEGKPTPLVYAAQTLEQSLSLYQQGHKPEAVQRAISAYLEGFELVEVALRNVDEPLMRQIERQMLGLRSAMQTGAPVEDVERQTREVITLLGEARQRLDGAQMSHSATAVSALLILLREGVEALLVVAAILAFTRRSPNPQASRWVHLGWVLALMLGGVTWAVSTYFVEISGAHREVTEGVTALIAAGMLLYIGYWMHSKANSQAWQAFIGGQVSGSLASGAFSSLALVSFLAVYREVFETVLFFQALAAQAGPEGHSALLGGAAVGALLLGVAGWLILRASVRLPIGLFFSVSGLLLVVMAVVFTGDGIAALQEAGYINATSVPFIEISWLGVRPTAQTLLAQAIAIALSAYALRRARVQRA